MTADERLALIHVKVDRAKKHISELDDAIKMFFSSRPFLVSVKRDQHSRKLIYYLSQAQPIPASIPAIAGDIVHNLRSALDHLAQQLFFTGSGRTYGASNKAFFLIERDAERYHSRLPRTVTGMRQDAVDALKVIEPYRGGKGHKLWVLHALNNIDKHRLFVAVGSKFDSVNIGAFISEIMQKASGKNFPTLDAFFEPADTLCPLKVGDELFVDEANADVSHKIQFRFSIALAEPDVIEGKPLLEMVQELSQVVSKVVLDFKPHLA